MNQESWENEWKDYYKILEIDRNANERTIKKNYRKLMQKYHPDLCQDENAEEKTKEINEAYEILSNPEKKKRYDEAWDNYQLHGNEQTTQNGNNEDPTVDFDTASQEYTEEEKRFAKKLALKKIIEDELSKAEIIINSKNEIIYRAYKEDFEKREYYYSVKELTRIGFEYIAGLNDLKQEAFKYDLLQEEEILSNTIEFLETELSNIPLSPRDARNLVNEENHKELLKSKVDEYCNKAKDKIDELRGLLIYVYKKEITPLDYNVIKNGIILKAKNILSTLNELMENTHSLGMEEETEQIMSIIRMLKSQIFITPSDYNVAIFEGEKESLKSEIRYALLSWQTTKDRIMRIIKMLNKYPNATIFPKVLNYGITLATDSQNNIKSLKEECHIVPNTIKEKETKLTELSKDAETLYISSEKLHIEAEAIYNFRETDNIALHKQIQVLPSAALANWDKSKAFTLMVEAYELLDKYNLLTNEDKELEELIRELKNALQECEQLLRTLVNLNNMQNKTASSNSKTAQDINSLIKELSKIEEMMKEKIKDIFVFGSVSLATSFYPIMVLLDGKPSEHFFEILLSLFLGGVSISSLAASIEAKKDYDLLKKESIKILKQISNG